MRKIEISIKDESRGNPYYTWEEKVGICPECGHIIAKFTISSYSGGISGLDIVGICPNCKVELRILIGGLEEAEWNHPLPEEKSSQQHYCGEEVDLREKPDSGGKFDGIDGMPEYETIFEVSCSKCKTKLGDMEETDVSEGGYSEFQLFFLCPHCGQELKIID